MQPLILSLDPSLSTHFSTLTPRPWPSSPLTPARRSSCPTSTCAASTPARCLPCSWQRWTASGRGRRRQRLSQQRSGNPGRPNPSTLFAKRGRPAVLAELCPKPLNPEISHERCCSPLRPQRAVPAEAAQEHLGPSRHQARVRHGRLRPPARSTKHGHWLTRRSSFGAARRKATLAWGPSTGSGNARERDAVAHRGSDAQAQR